MTEQKSNAFQMDYVGGFTFLFKDKNWANNLLIGSIYMLIPIVGPMILMGWHCEIMQRLCRRHPQPIPKLEFSDFGYFLGRGVSPFVIGLILSIPFVFFVWIFIIICAVGFASAASQHISGPTLAVGGLLACLVLLGCILIPMVIFANALMTRVYLTEDIGKTLNFQKILSYAKQTWKKILIAYLFFLPLTLMAMVAGAIVLYIGMYPAMVVINLAWVYLAWEIYERYLSEGGEAIEINSTPKPIPSEQHA